MQHAETSEVVRAHIVVVAADVEQRDKIGASSVGVDQLSGHIWQEARALAHCPHAVSCQENFVSDQSHQARSAAHEWQQE